ncbi:MAG: hypothetical protein KDD35_08960 [Bdellovibrionales bacterium]|nr:hypothetical protein [Bdellovibrionales bacterium]
MKRIGVILNFFAAVFVVLLFIELGAAVWFFSTSENGRTKNLTESRFPMIDFFAENENSRMRDSTLNRRRLDYFEKDPILGLRFRPHAEVYSIVPDEDGRPILSKQGLLTDKYGMVSNSRRSEDINFNLQETISDPLTYLVVVSGSSSSIWGASSNEKTWPALLEKKLNTDREWLRKLGYRKVVVLNTATFSHTISQEVMRLLNESIYWRPDMVISFNGPNKAALKYYGNPVDFSHHWSQRLLMKNSKIDSIFMPFTILPYSSILMSYLIKKKEADGSGFRKESYPKLAYSTLYKTKINQMEVISRSAGADFLWVLNPQIGICDDEKLLPSEQSLQTFFAEKLWKLNWKSYISNLQQVSFDLRKYIQESNNKNFLDFSCVFSGHSKRVYSDPQHYVDEGHKVIADEIFKRIRTHIKSNIFELEAEKLGASLPFKAQH